MADAVTAALVRTPGRRTAVIYTAYIERLNATCRARLTCLPRHGRTGVHQHDTTDAEMWVVGADYNFCCLYPRLRQRQPTDQSPAQRWIERTPAGVAGLTDHRWSIHKLLAFPVPGVGIGSVAVEWP